MSILNPGKLLLKREFSEELIRPIIIQFSQNKRIYEHNELRETTPHQLMHFGELKHYYVSP